MKYILIYLNRDEEYLARTHKIVALSDRENIILHLEQSKKNKYSVEDYQVDIWENEKHIKLVDGLESRTWENFIQEVIK